MPMLIRQEERLCSCILPEKPLLLHLPDRPRPEAIPVSIILASGQVEAFLLLDEVFVPDVKTPLCPLRRLTMKLDVAI
eukprot:108792-Amphidinium_carterae.2